MCWNTSLTPSFCLSPSAEDPSRQVDNFTRKLGNLVTGVGLRVAASGISGLSEAVAFSTFFCFENDKNISQ